MSLIKEKRRYSNYYTFQMGARKKLYLGPEDSPDPLRIQRALEYVKGRIGHYSLVLKELESLHSKGISHRREEVSALTSKLDHGETDVLVKLSLVQVGLSAYEIERRGIPRARILPSLSKLSRLGLLEVASQTRTPAGRRISKYRTNALGAEIALESLRRAARGDITEEKLREMVEADLDSTPLGRAYRQLQAVEASRVRKA